MSMVGYGSFIRSLFRFIRSILQLVGISLRVLSGVVTFVSLFI